MQLQFLMSPLVTIGASVLGKQSKQDERMRGGGQQPRACGKVAEFSGAFDQRIALNFFV